MTEQPHPMPPAFRPVPAVPAEIEPKADNDCAHSYAQGWNDYRRALLAAPAQQAEPEPEVDGWPLWSGLPPAPPGNPTASDWRALVKAAYEMGKQGREIADLEAEIDAPARQACVCGEPATQGVAHRQDGPCHMTEAPSLTVGEPTEFTDWGRAAVAWVLWHHQGGSSAIGQPLRFALGLGAHEPLPAHLVAAAQEWAKSVGTSTDEFHRQKAQPAAQAEPAAWRPIETAPKDGRKLILAYVNRNNKARTVMARWLTDEQAAETDADDVGLEGGWYECIDNWDDYTEVAIQEGEPSHWMPIPPAPGSNPPAQGKEG